MPVPILQRIVILFGAAVAILAVAWLQTATRGLAVPPRAARPDPPLATLLEEPDPAHPLPAPPLRAMPSLERSDEAVRGALRRIAGGEGLLPVLAPGRLIRRFVTTVDALTQPSMPSRISPLVFTPSAPPSQDVHPDTRVLGDADFARYRPLVDALDAVDTRAAVALYWRLYPLMQEAYAEAAPGKGYFNDRLIRAIEHLLQTPAPGTALAVVHAGNRYHFADPRLDACSAGQKLLLRMGPANAARLEAKMRDARKLLALRRPAG